MVHEILVRLPDHKEFCVVGTKKAKNERWKVTAQDGETLWVFLLREDQQAGWRLYAYSGGRLVDRLHLRSFLIEHYQRHLPYIESMAGEARRAARAGDDPESVVLPWVMRQLHHTAQLLAALRNGDSYMPLFLRCEEGERQLRAMARRVYGKKR